MSGESWFDLNESRRFPFADNAEIGSLPDSLFADLQIVFPDSATYGVAPTISSISVGESYVSFVVEVDGTPVAWYGGDKVTRTVLPLTALVAGTSGTVVFGGGVVSARLREDLTAAPLAEGTYQRYIPQRIPHLGVNKYGNAAIDLTGIIDLRVDNNLEIALVENVTVSTGGGPVVVAQAIELRLRDEVAEDVRRVIEGHNHRQVAADTCDPNVINYINGVRPDINGNLTIRVVSDLVLMGAASGEIQFKTTLSATRDCDTVGNTDPIEIVDQGCN